MGHGRFWAAEEREVFGGWGFGGVGFRVGVGGGFFGEGSCVFEDGEREAGVVFAGFGEESGEVLRGGFDVVGDGSVVDGGGELLEEGGEFELGEEVAAGGVVDGLGAHGFEGVLDGDAGVDGDEFFREEDVVAVVL